MPTSSNGWSASPDLPIRPLVIDGEAFVPGVRDDNDVYEVLRYVAQQLHERVEPIVRGDWHQMDDWGFSYRANVNSPNSLSNHSSGTAFDYNATRHPNGVPASSNFTPQQIATIRQILAEVGGAVRWGGDYNGTPDAMHFEIDVSPAQLAPIAARIREREWFEMATPDDLKAAVKAGMLAAFEEYDNEKITVRRITKTRAQWEREALKPAADALRVEDGKG